MDYAFFFQVKADLNRSLTINNCYQIFSKSLLSNSFSMSMKYELYLFELLCIYSNSNFATNSWPYSFQCMVFYDVNVESKTIHI